MIRFCIFAEPRSGTTFFNRSINFHPNVKSFGEIMPGHDGEHGFHRFWLDQVYKDNSKISLQHVHQVFQSYIRSLFSRRTQSSLGFDIKYYQLEWKSDFLNILKLEKFKIIHIIRSNLLRRHVSWVLHQPEIRDILRRPMHTGGSHEPILVMVQEPEKLISVLTRYQHTIKHYSTVFNDNFPCLPIHYEAMIDPEKNYLTPEVSNLVFDFLEVSPLHDYPCTPLKKINPTKLRYSVLNYYQIVLSLKGSEFEILLDDHVWDQQHLELHKELYLGHTAAENDPAKALVHYLRANAVDPFDAEPYYYLALTYALTSQHSKMNSMFEKAFSCCNDAQRLPHYHHAQESIHKALSMAMPSRSHS